MVAWDIAEREDPVSSSERVRRTSLRKRNSKGHQQQLILNANNGKAMRAATSKVWLAELGVL